MSRLIEGERLTTLTPIIEEASRIALTSTCQKDKRGAVVYKNGQVLSSAANGPVPPFICDGKTCYRFCGLIAMHAERSAIVRALEQGKDLSGASILHVRVNEVGEVQTSGPLRCEDCTGYMARVKRKVSLEDVVLKQAGGWTAYEIYEADTVARRNREVK